jgi:hypothetical protein
MGSIREQKGPENRPFGMIFEPFLINVCTVKDLIMKKKVLLLLPLAMLMLASSCVSVRVIADYDRDVDFNTYNTYAFYKTGIDKATISDLDKKRILRAIENEMATKGFVKSESPDLLVSIFTKEREQVDVYNNAGWGGWGWGGFGWGGFGWGGFGWGPGWGWGGPWGWGPGWGWGGSAVSTRTEGSLYIDLIDAKTRELIWQGRGVGTLNNIRNIDKKEARIREFVTEIMERYPPAAEPSS